MLFESLINYRMRYRIMQIVATERKMNEDGNQSVVRFFIQFLYFMLLNLCYVLFFVSVDFNFSNFLILSFKNQRDRWMWLRSKFNSLQLYKNLFQQIWKYPYNCVDFTQLRVGKSDISRFFDDIVILNCCLLSPS